MRRENPVHAILSGVEPVLDQLERFSVEVYQRTGASSVVSSRRRLNVGNDKLRTCQWLEANGMLFPLYTTADDDSGLRSLLEAAGFPLIAKPGVGKGAQGIRMIHSMPQIWIRSKAGQTIPYRSTSVIQSLSIPLAVFLAVMA